MSENEALLAEPFKIKMVEPINDDHRAERERRIARPATHVLLKSEDVYIDLLTTRYSAMSDASGRHDARRRSTPAAQLLHLEAAVREIYGKVRGASPGRAPSTSSADHDQARRRAAGQHVLHTTRLHRSWPGAASSM